MAFDASPAQRPGRVEMMARGIVLRGRVALQTHSVAGRAEPRGVRLMTVATGHARVVHPALDKRAVLVNFVLYLAVRKIEVVVKQRDPVVVADGLSVHVVLMDLTSARMASRTHLDLTLRRARRATDHVSARRIDLPNHAAALVKRD